MRFRVQRLLGGSAILGLAAAAWLAAPASAEDASAQGDPQFSWELLDSGTSSLFASLDSVSADVAWAGDIDGEIMRTVDGGATFTDVAPPEGADDALAFTDIEAVDALEALALAQPPDGDDGTTRIYRTTNGGTTWRETFRGQESFLNCMAMFDRRHGFALADPVDGKFQIIATSDAGRSWNVLPGDGMPDALEGEAGLGFGGDCTAATGRRAFFGTGFAAEVRVFRSSDFGLTWEVGTMPEGVGDGIFALDFRTNALGLSSGFARTTDGGATWQLANGVPAGGGQLAWWADRRGDERQPSDAQRTVFAAADGGSFVSRDRGKAWEHFDDTVLRRLECAEGTRACWGAGFDGQIAKLVVS